MKWRRIVPTCFTLGILFLGFQSILKSVAGEFGQAAQLIVLAAILDGMDGEVARLFRGVTTFGAKLDTYVDTVAFGVAPAVLVYQAVWGAMGLWGTLFAASIVASGVIRFARYQVKDSRITQHTFHGLPIPVSAVWMAMIVLLTESSLLTDGRFPLDKASLAFIMWVFTFAFLFLQVSNVRYAKPTKEMISWALLGELVLILVLGKPVLAFCLGTSIAMLLYAVAVPIYVHGALPDEDSEEEAPVKLRWFR